MGVAGQQEPGSLSLADEEPNTTADVASGDDEKSQEEGESDSDDQDDEAAPPARVTEIEELENENKQEKTTNRRKFRFGRGFFGRRLGKKKA